MTVESGVVAGQRLASAERLQARGDLLVQVFSSIGHGFMHLLAAYYYVVALRLEREWGRSYADLLGLWTIGAALVGLMALPAGWLADRWSVRGMMAVFFTGLGASAMFCGAAAGPRQLEIALALLGAFAAIYHPVGLPWVVRHAERKGRALGLNGIFGSLGVALAGVVAGGLSDTVGWRAAFVLPGAVSLALGAALVWCIARGWIPESRVVVASAPGAEGPGAWRVLWVLVFTMLSGSLIYQGTQAALPKSVSLALPGTFGASTVGVGALVGLVYGVASVTQVVAGHLADRYALTRVYVAGLFGQVPLLWLMASVSGWPFVTLAVAAVVVNTGALPAENLLLAASTPPHRQGLAFGVRFVLVFGSAPLAIRFVSFAGQSSGTFGAVFVAGAALAAAAGLAALQLPSDRGRST